jgi:hypothetical protein
MSDRFSVDDLLRADTDTDGHRGGAIVRLEGRDGLDGYNPSGPMTLDGSRYAYVRMEPRGDEFSSWAVPFRQLSEEDWVIDRDLLTPRMARRRQIARCLWQDSWQLSSSHACW